jgi:cytochrome c peroxidase
MHAMKSLRMAAFTTALAMLATGCGRADELTYRERQLLTQFRLGPLPPSLSNAKADNAKAADLGKRFFFDTRFSGRLVLPSDLGIEGQDGRVACASCHDPASGGSDHRSHGNTSLAAGWTGRNAPTVYNSAYNHNWLFWDGRRDSVWSQALGPSESPVEHNGSRLQFAHIIQDNYEADYEAVFGLMPDVSALPPSGKPGGEPGAPDTLAWEGLSPQNKVDVNRIFSNFGKAIEAYERLLLDKDSAFDRYMEGGDDAIPPEAVRGLRLFVGKASCIECHGGPTFSDGEFHNLGVPQIGPAVPERDRGRAAGIAGVVAAEFNRASDYSDRRETDHLVNLTATPVDEGAFKTPTLRSISKTGPYMHTGAFETLRDVINFYRYGGGTSGYVGQKDPAIKPLFLTDAEVDDLVAFLRTLDGTPLPSSLTQAP